MSSAGSGTAKRRNGVQEASYAFAARMGIASNEGRKTSYGPRLLNDSGYMDDGAFASIHADCEELLKLRYPIVKSAKQNVGPPYSSFFITHSPLNPCCATT